MVEDVQRRVERAGGSLLVGASGKGLLQLTVLVLSRSMENAFEDRTSGWFVGLAGASRAGEGSGIV